MAEIQEIPLDTNQVKKAVQALQAFIKSKQSNSALLDETQQISLLFTLWKIPKGQQTIRIPLPHGQRKDTDDICLFTKDEPNMSPDQTQRFYKKLLQERGVTNITEVIPFKMLKTEYKPYEAKRRLLGNFTVFLSDDRIRRLLPSHIGKHFYERKKEPLSVNLQSKQLARDIQRVVQGTNFKVNNKGCCCMAHVAHSNMTADEVTENIEATVRTVVAKLRMKGPVIKLIHIKSQRSVALPIYTSDLSHYAELQEAARIAKIARKKREGAKKPKKEGEEVKETGEAAEGKENGEEEEIPQLVPIATPSKTPKLQKPNKKKNNMKKKEEEEKLEQAPKPAEGKPAGKQKRKAGKKMDASKQKRKVPRVK